MNSQKSEKVPEIISREPWLHYFGSSKNIVFLVDGKGGFVWGVNFRNHIFPEFSAELASRPLHENFDLPVSGNLNAVMEWCRKKHGDRLMTGPIGRITDMTAISTGSFPSFPSNNRAEIKTSACTRFFDAPYSRLRLVNLDDRNFIAIVNFSDNLYSYLFEYNSAVEVFVDDKGKIFGYSSAFLGLMQARENMQYLGLPLAELLEMDRSLEDIAAGLEEPAWRPAFSWTAGNPFPSAGGEELELGRLERGLSWQNTQCDGLLYLMADRPFCTGADDFRIRVRFGSPAGLLPNLILATDQAETTSFPDLTGYAFSNSVFNASYMVKKRAVILRFFPLAGLPDGATHCLTLEKVRNHFSLSLDDRPLGAFFDAFPLQQKTKITLGFFLRSGEKILLNALEAETAAPLPEKHLPFRISLTARMRTPLGHFKFNVAVNYGTLNYTNYVRYQLDDITELQEDIDSLMQQKARLTGLIKQDHVFIGRSPAIMRIKEEMQTVARSPLSVLIEGDTGTGKEMLAYSIHQASNRRQRPFVKIDCTTIPRELMESELFGHEKGAFTGAVASRKGRFEQAEGGTVFLDEVANLPLSVQAKLLAVLQDHVIYHVGGTRAIKLDIRLLAASNVPLFGLIEREQFRSDLFYRLNQYYIHVPSLAQRSEDIPLLIEHFLKEANDLYKKKVRRLSGAAMKKIFLAPWPGNIRELKNVIHRAVLFCPGEELSEEDIGLEGQGVFRPAVSAPSPAGGNWGGARKRSTVDKEKIVKVLQETSGNISLASTRLGVSRFVIYKTLRSAGITLAGFRSNAGKEPI